MQPLQSFPVKLEPYIELLTDDVSGNMEYTHIIFGGNHHYTDYKTVLRVLKTLSNYFYGIVVVENEKRGASLLCKYASQLLYASEEWGNWALWPEANRKATVASMLETHPFMCVIFDDRPGIINSDLIQEALKRKIPILWVRHRDQYAELRLEK